MYMMSYDQFMNRPLNLMQEIEHKAEDVAFKWSLCLNSTQGYSERVQTSPKNTSDLKIIRYAEADRELTELQTRYDEACEAVRAFLYDNLDLHDADVLDWRYCNGKSIKEIAEIKNLTYSGAANKLNRAEKRARQKYAQNRKSEKECE